MNLAPVLIRVYNSVLKKREIIIFCIPKEGKDRQECDHLRPISVLNMDYRVFASIIARALERCQTDLIHFDQAGLIKQRQMQNRTLHIIWMVTENNIESTLLSLDAQKAFDAVWWKKKIHTKLWVNLPSIKISLKYFKQFGHWLIYYILLECLIYLEQPTQSLPELMSCHKRYGSVLMYQRQKHLLLIMNLLPTRILLKNTSWDGILIQQNIWVNIYQTTWQKSIHHQFWPSKLQNKGRYKKMECCSVSYFWIRISQMNILSRLAHLFQTRTSENPQFAEWDRLKSRLYGMAGAKN